jgi:superfamily II DNA or RNA helicase
VASLRLSLTIDSKIHFRLTPDIRQTEPQFVQAIRDDMLVDNPEYAEAVNYGRYAGNIPEHIVLWEYDALTGTLAVPRGYGKALAALLRSFRISWDAVDERVTLNPVGFGSKVVLRDYQVPAVEAAIKATGGVLQAPAGSGKTEVGLEIIARLQQPALWLTHTKDLANQAAERACRVLGLERPEVGLIGDGVRKIGDRLTIGIIQTLTRMDLAELGRQFGTVVLDECFPAGTLIDGRPIETVKVGDTVTAWDENNRQPVPSKVVRLFKRPAPSRLIKLSVGGKTIVCTPTHPFLTRFGWVPAILLPEGRELLYVDQASVSDLRKNQEHQQSKIAVSHLPSSPDASAFEDRDNLQRMWESGHADQTDQEGSFQVRALSEPGSNMLLGCVQGHAEKPYQFSSDGQDEPEICFGSDEKEQPNERSGNQSASCGHKTGKGQLETGASRRQWQRPNETAAATSSDSGLADGNSDPDQDAQGQRISDLLQSGYREPQTKDCHRSGRPFPLQPQRLGSEEGYVPRLVRVDRVEVLKPGSDGMFGGLCPDGHVYNFEVGHHHTYTANGFVVHNCHHGSSPTWVHVMNQLSARYRFGVTATPERADGLQVITERVIGPTFHTVSRVAVSDRLMVPTLTVINTGVESAVWKRHAERMKEYQKRAAELRLQGKVAPKAPIVDWSTLLDELLTHDERNLLIVETLLRECPGHYALVLSKRVEHCLQLAHLLNKAELDRGIKPRLRSSVIHGGLAKKVREKIIELTQAGKCDVLFAVEIAKEGLDIPRLDRLFLVGGGRNEAVTEQQVGRIQRPFTDTLGGTSKLDAAVFDFVDELIPPLRAQHWARRKVYRRLGMPNTGSGLKRRGRS